MQLLWKTVWRFLKKLKIELPYDPAIPILGIYPDKTIIQRDTCTPMFTAVLFIAMWIDLERIISGEVSQTEKDKCHVTYMWN